MHGLRVNLWFIRNLLCSLIPPFNHSGFFWPVHYGPLGCWVSSWGYPHHFWPRAIALAFQGITFLMKTQAKIWKLYQNGKQIKSKFAKCISRTKIHDLHKNAWLASRYLNSQKCPTCTKCTKMPELPKNSWLAQKCLICTKMHDLHKNAWLAQKCITCKTCIIFTKMHLLAWPHEQSLNF